MRILSTPGLHRDIEEKTGVALTEHSSDADRIRAARYVWKSRKPDLMLLYNPGLDTIEHGDGPYSGPAFRHLEMLGHEIEAFLDEIERGADAQHTRVLIVSDHGFLTYQGKCFPNSILKSMGYIDLEARRWSYYFETAGGVARLIRNGDAVPGVAALFPGKAFAERLQASCPEVEVVGEQHDLFRKLRQSYDRKSPLFLVSKGKTVMTAAVNKVEFADIKGHTHGFMPDRPDMHTVAILFGPGRAKAQKIRHVKQVFGSVCSWLKLACPVQKSTAAPR
jgi:predicted AlkP superfamily pyrophosphatase or phosphodiesterase